MEKTSAPKKAIPIQGDIFARSKVRFLAMLANIALFSQDGVAQKKVRPIRIGAKWCTKNTGPGYVDYRRRSGSGLLTWQQIEARRRGNPKGSYSYAVA